MVDVAKSSPCLLVILANATLLEMVPKKDPAAHLNGFVEIQPIIVNVMGVLHIERLKESIYGGVDLLF